MGQSVFGVNDDGILVRSGDKCVQIVAPHSLNHGIFISTTILCWQATRVVAGSTIESVRISILRASSELLRSGAKVTALRAKLNRAPQEYGETPTTLRNGITDASMHQHLRGIQQASKEG